MLVSALMRASFAFAMMALDTSVTVPLITPFPVCAQTAAQDSKATLQMVLSMIPLSIFPKIQCAAEGVNGVSRTQDGGEVRRKSV